MVIGRVSRKTAAVVAGSTAFGVIVAVCVAAVLDDYALGAAGGGLALLVALAAFLE